MWFIIGLDLSYMVGHLGSKAVAILKSWSPYELSRIGLLKSSLMNVH